MTGTERVAARLVSGQTSREVPGQAVSAGDGTHVQVQIGVQVWTATDLPKRPAAVGDMLTIRERQGSRQVVRNLTREANPPTAPSDASVSGSSASGSTGATGITSSGCYAWTDGTQLGNYARDIAASTRGLAADLNSHDDMLADHAGLINDLIGTVSDQKNDIATLKNTINALMTQLKTAGVIQ